MNLTSEQQGAALAILLANQHKTYNCTSLMFTYQERYGISIDWHEFSMLLDHWNTIGVVEVSHIDNCGRVNYRLAENVQEQL